MMAAPNWVASAGEPLSAAGNFAGGNIIDAEFETVSRTPIAQPRPVTRLSPPEAAIPLDQLALLRSDDAEISSHPDRLTPAFMFFTLLAAFVVFWVSGGHVLLY